MHTPQALTQFQVFWFVLFWRTHWVPFVLPINAHVWSHLLEHGQATKDHNLEIKTVHPSSNLLSIDSQQQLRTCDPLPLPWWNVYWLALVHNICAIILPMGICKSQDNIFLHKELFYVLIKNYYITGNLKNISRVPK